MAEQEPANVIVTIDDRYLDRLGEVAERLKAAGLDVQQQLASAGVLTGTVSSDQLAALQSLEGVAAVEKSYTYQLPPPDSPIQ
jgi:hypothetical protein